MGLILTTPKTELELQQYYDLRWRILRKPWGQPEGSERDEIDDRLADKIDTPCHHVMMIEKNIVCGVARLEFSTDKLAQLRYMAVDNLYQGQGIGRCIVEHMELIAREKNVDELFLHARENAVGFYEKLGYVVTEKSYLLFGSIQHFKMVKRL